MSEYVFGLNKSGLSVIKLLRTQKKSFDCWDDSKKIRQSLKKKFSNLNFISNKNSNLTKYNNIYLTPGISIDDEKFINEQQKIEPLEPSENQANQ